MARNPYFKDYSGEQNLIDDLTTETIRAMGRDMMYIPRDRVSTDDLFGEDISTKFEDAYPIEMYIQTVDGFEGEGDVISQYGLQIKDRVELIVSKRRFNEVVKSVENISRPREGDLVYFPLSNTLFEINFVEHENPFYQLAKNYSYRLSCETFTFDAGQDIETGVTELDEVETCRETVVDGVIIQQEPETSTSSGDNDNVDFDNNIFDFTESDPFSEGSY